MEMNDRTRLRIAHAAFFLQGVVRNNGYHAARALYKSCRTSVADSRYLSLKILFEGLGWEFPFSENDEMSTSETMMATRISLQKLNQLEVQYGDFDGYTHRTL